MREGKIRVMIVDDEPLARKFIRRMLKDDSEVEIVGECVNGLDAVEAIGNQQPDLIFLDVQMPEMDGFSVLQEINVKRMPQIVFTTAYAQHALRAFEMHALDYLLKPFDQVRFGKAMQHAREQLRRPRGGDEMLNALVEHITQRAERLRRLVIKVDGRIVFLKLNEIYWIEADDKYVHIHLRGQSHMVRQTMSVIETQLDSKKFLRIHRSTIVNIERIRELYLLSSGEQMLIMEDGTKLTVSRGYKDKVFELIGKPL